MKYSCSFQRYLAPIIGALLLITSLAACDKTPSDTDIIVTLKPIHSIVMALTKTTTLKVQLLGGGISSPHHYALKPSDMAQLNAAKMIIQISPDLERFLVKPLATLAPNHKIIHLIDAKNITLISIDTPHKHISTVKDLHETEHHETGHSDFLADQHIWLDPINMIVIAQSLQQDLITQFPQHRFTINQNARLLIDQLKELDQKIKSTLAAVQNQNFMVYHNAFQYFEKRYHLQNKGSLTLSSHTQPGSHHVIEMRNKMKHDSIRCLFTEPGKVPPLVKVLIEGSTVKAAPLSPLGTSLKPSRFLYFDMMEQLAKDYKTCLSKQ